jgi:hypothetical protein
MDLREYILVVVCDFVGLKWTLLTKHVIYDGEDALFEKSRDNSKPPGLQKNLVSKQDGKRYAY